MRTVHWFSNYGIALTIAVSLCSLGTAQVRDAASSELIGQLEDKGVEVRRDAAYELARRGDSSDPVIAALGRATADDDTQVRVQALTGLARAGKKSFAVISELLKCLGNRDDQVRYRAAVALGAIGIESVKPLEAYWISATNDSQIATAQAFAIIGPAAISAAPKLLEALQGKDGLPRYAAEALVSMSPQDEVTLLRLSGHPDPSARRVGILGIASLGSLSESSLQVLSKALVDPEPKIREIAIIAAAKSPLQIAEKSTAIEAALVDPSESVRAAAIVAVKKASLPPAQFSQRIVARLHSKDIEAINTVVKAIAVLGPEARGVFPALVEVAQREGIDKQLLSQTLAGFGADVVDELLLSIEHQPVNEPIFSEALGLIGEPAVKFLMQGMSSDVELVRVAATRALSGVRPMNKTIMEQLASSVKDRSAKVRALSVASLIAAGKDADFAKNTILDATQDAEDTVRTAAIQALRAVRFTDEQTQQVLERGLSDASPEVRASALSVVGDTPKLLRSKLKELATMVSDSDAKVRTTAAQTLGKLDKKSVSETLVKACVTGLRDSDHLVRIAATESVKSLGLTEPDVLDALAGNLVDDLELLRVTLDAVSGFDGKAAGMIPAISLLVSHEKADLRCAALNALAAIEKDREQLVGRLMDALDDIEWDVRRTAGVALGKIGPDAKKAVPKLFGKLGMDQDREYAGNSLKEINTASVEAIPTLIKGLDAEESRTAFYAVSLLGKIGPPAAEALPKLEALLAKPRDGDKGRSEFRRKFLVEAIASIKGEPKSDK